LTQGLQQTECAIASAHAAASGIPNAAVRKPALIWQRAVSPWRDVDQIASRESGYRSSALSHATPARLLLTGRLQKRKLRVTFLSASRT
jgi:hypothetical protein